MKLPKDLKGISRGLDGILDRLDKLENTVKDSFEKIKGNIVGFPKYLKEIEYKTYEKLRETKNKISEYIPIYIPIVGGAAITALPTYAWYFR